MRCLYCGGPVVASKGLAESEFCSNDHRFRYEAVSRLARHEYQFPVERPAPVVTAAVLSSARSWISREAPFAFPVPETPHFTLKAANGLYSLIGAWSFRPVGPRPAFGPAHPWINPRIPPQLPVLHIPLRVSTRSSW